MSSLQEFAYDFDRGVQQRGRDYFKRRAVRVSRSSDQSVAATVQGGETYHTRIEWDGDAEADYDCTCPYFQDRGGEPCKHLWATLLQADKDGLLPQSLEPAPDEGGDEGEAGDGGGEEGGAGSRPNPARAGQGTGGEKAKVDMPSWKRELARLREHMQAYAQPAQAPPPLAWPDNRRVVYVIDAPATTEGTGLTIELAQETAKKDGRWDRPRQLRIGREQILSLPDEADRQIVQMLLGARRGDYGYYDYYDSESPRRFVLPESTYFTTFKQMVQTGRCRLRKAQGEEQPDPVAWDDAEPWEFWLEVKPSPGGRYYLVDGLLRRGGGDGQAEGEAQRRPLSDAQLLVRGRAGESAAGLVFLDGKVARLNHFDAFALILSLRQGMKLTVPLDQRDELLRLLFALPRLPRLDLPEELRFEQTHPKPRPRLMVKKPTGKHYDERLVGELTFDYAGQTVSAADEAHAVVSPEGRKVLYRDADAERAALAKLHQLGFRESYEYYGRNAGGANSLRLPATKLPKVVAELTAEGWHVEADGKLYRQPGEFKVQVSSGIDWFELHGSVSFGDQSAALPKLLAALRRGEKSVLLDDGSFGLLPQEWLKKYAPLAGLGETVGDHVQFNRRQVGFLDALLSSMPEATADATFARARDELMRFEGVKPLDAPQGFTGELRAYQRDGLGWMAFLRKFGFGGCLADDMGLGKAQPLDARVLTPRGWKLMGEVEVGDEVINSQGGTSRVTGVYPQGDKEIFRVVFSDGSSAECCDEHLWQVTSPVRKYRGQGPQVLPLSEIRQSLIDGSGNRRHFIPLVGPVEFASQGLPLPLDPYLLGVLLGDGGIAHRVILSSADEELVGCAAALPPPGVSVGYTGKGVDYRIRSAGRGVRNAVAEELRSLRLMGCRSGAKFVPDAFKFASAQARLDLLRGLLDTDGHVRPVDNNVEFCSVSRRLAEDVQFLVQSLGGTARIRTKPTSGQLAYRMSIALPDGVRPFRLRRKADVYHPRAKYPPSRAIVAVEPVGPKPAQCIRVDAPDSLYVTDNFIVTHNTVQVLALLEARRQLRTSHVPAGASKRGNVGGNGEAGGNGDRHTKSPAGPAAEARPGGPSLVVVPKSLVFNWKQEAAKFTPALRVLDHTGAQRPKDTEGFADYDLILTTYGTLRRDAAQFKDVDFDYAILDEAQAIKNASSESAKATRLLRAGHRLALSGTPVQNHLGELWSLFEFLNPGMMGTASVFKETTAATGSADPQAREMLARALRPFVLRRTKEQVAKDLPAKLEQTVYCEMESAQRKLYDELRDHYRTSLLDRIAREGMNKAKIQVLEALLRLRQAACHPGLIDKARAKEGSAKLDALLEQVGAVLGEGHKVLVFSQFTSLLAIVRDRFDAQKTTYEYLDGKTRDRQARVERFQNDPACKLFLISLKAGGLGLNLTAAEYVFLLDPWWNPAVEAQAIDRAHRIGQTRQVFAYRLIAKDTVEEKVLQLQQSKKDLADAIISADNSLIRSLGREDLELLLS